MDIQKLINKQHAEIAKLEAELQRLRTELLYAVIQPAENARQQNRVWFELKLRKEFVNELEGLN